jgi:hypothetical protein
MWAAQQNYDKLSGIGRLSRKTTHEVAVASAVVLGLDTATVLVVNTT